MDVEGQLDLVADRLAHGLELLDRREHRAARLEDSIFLGQAPAHKLPALRFGLEARIDQWPDLHRVADVVWVADDLIAYAAAQQVVDRDAQRLAFDIPQRDIDRRDRRHQDALGREEAPAGEPLPDMLDPRRILADQQWLEVLDRADHR